MTHSVSSVQEVGMEGRDAAGEAVEVGGGGVVGGAGDVAVGSPPHTRFRIVVAHACAAVGMSLPWPLLLDLVWERTNDGFVLGATGAARMLPYVLFSWWVAGLADRFGRGRVVGLTLWSRTALLVGAGWCLVGTPSTAGLAGAVLLATAAVACGTPAYPALVAALPAAGAGTGRRATGLLVTVEVSSFVVGPALGGLALGRLSPTTVLLAGAALTLVARAVMMGVRLPEVAGADGDGVDGVDGNEPVKVKVLPLLRRSLSVRGAIAAICVMNLVDAALLVALVPIADARWGSPSAYGEATAAFGFGALAAPLLFWLGRSATRQVHWGMALVAAALTTLVPLTAMTSVLVVLALTGAASVHVEAAATELLQAHVPDRVRAHVLGVTDALMVGAAMIGSFVGPVLVEAIGGSGSLVVLAGFTVVAGIVVLPVASRGRASRRSAPISG